MGTDEIYLERYYHHDDFVFSDNDDQIGRATSCEEWLSITIVNSDTEKDTTWNWRPDGARGAFRRFSWTWLAR